MEVVPIYQLPFHAAFLIFIIFSVIGWISEEIYVGLLSQHKLINRGFLHGPLCPIYGFGGVVILMLPKQLYSTWIPLFFASMILCTIVEYISSYVLEILFHTRWWDYSKKKVNIKGRVCLLNSILFGFLGLGVIHFVYPQIIKLLNLVSEVWLKIIAAVIAIILVVDIIITVANLVDFTATLEKLKTFKESLKDHYGQEEWFRNTSLGEMMASIKEHHGKEKNKINQSIIQKIEIIQAFRHKNVERIVKKFPTINSEHFKTELSDIKNKIKLIEDNKKESKKANKQAKKNK